VGDPPGYVLDDCATQRNLSDAGRAQARRLGETFRARGLAVADKPDSHDICFIPSGDTQAFLGARIGVRAGAVVDAANRPAWIANISNDAWFGPSGPPQHLAQARLRAIEEGLPIARATPTGISAMIDARGRVTGAIPAGIADTLPVSLPAALQPTLFARHGHGVPAVLGVLLLIAAVIFDRGKSNRII
jgi:hypothetical protein